MVKNKKCRICKKIITKDMFPKTETEYNILLKKAAKAEEDVPTFALVDEDGDFLHSSCFFMSREEKEKRSHKCSYCNEIKLDPYEIGEEKYICPKCFSEISEDERNELALENEYLKKYQVNKYKKYNYNQLSIEEKKQCDLIKSQMDVFIEKTFEFIGGKK